VSLSLCLSEKGHLLSSYRKVKIWLISFFPLLLPLRHTQVEVDTNYKSSYESGYWRGILDAQGKTDGGYY